MVANSINSMDTSDDTNTINNNPLLFAENPMFTIIRSQINSGLDNQKQAAVILRAVEETIIEQGESLTPIAYFGSLMTVLDQQKESAVEDESKQNVITAVVYLLATVFPNLPHSILRHKFTEISSILTTTLTIHDDNAPLVRSILGCIESLLRGQDHASWTKANTTTTTPTTTTNSTPLRQLFNLVCHFGIDPRPKVRKRAQEAIRSILSHPPAPAVRHPCSGWIVEFCKSVIVQFLSQTQAQSAQQPDNNSTSSKKSKKTAQKEEQMEREQRVFHVLVFLKSIIQQLTTHIDGANRSKLAALTGKILDILAFAPADSIMTSWVFQVLESLFLSSESDFSIMDVELVDGVLRELLKMKPNPHDKELTPVWLQVVGNGFTVLGRLVNGILKTNSSSNAIMMMMTEDQQLVLYATKDYPVLFTMFWESTFANLLGTNGRKQVITKATEVFIKMLQSSLTDQMLQQAMTTAPTFTSEEVETSQEIGLTRIMQFLITGLRNARYRESWGIILDMINALYNRFCLARQNGVINQYQIRDYTLPLLSLLGSLRDQRDYNSSFMFKPNLDGVLIAITKTIGIELVLELLPLNLDRKEQPTMAPRPWLLVLFKCALEEEAASLKVGKDIVGDKVEEVRDNDNEEEKDEEPEEQTPATTPTTTRKPLFGINSLHIFTTIFLPISKRLFTRSSNFQLSSKPIEAKLWETLGVQVWDLLVPLCSTCPNDIAEYFHSLGPVLGRLLQSPWEMTFSTNGSEMELPSGTEIMKEVFERAAILSCIELIDSQTSLLTSTASDETKTKAQRNIAKLAEFANKFLSTLCNKLTQVPLEVLGADANVAKLAARKLEKDKRLYEGAVARWLGIADGEATKNYFITLIQTLLQLQSTMPSSKTPTDADPDTEEHLQTKYRIYSILDLLHIMLPYLPEFHSLETKLTTIAELPSYFFYKCLHDQLRDSDGILQKKTYKSLTTCLQLLSGITAREIIPTALNLEPLLTQMIDPAVLQSLHSGCKKQRFNCFVTIVELIPMERKEILLSVVPIVLSEVILGTKESGEKSRVAAFEVLVRMGHKMMEMSSEETIEGETNISISEYFMMVVAGLAGSTPHMQSATITCLGRLLFEFRETLSNELVHDLIELVLVNLDSKNREIVKSTLGFIKIVIVSVVQDLVQDHLESLVTKIVACNHTHRNHFKVKIRHIFERLIRRFSYEAVEGFVPEVDHKMIVNIRKRKERARKKKAQSRNEENESGDEDSANKSSKTNKTPKSYEDAVYGSESEIESDDESDLDGDNMDIDKYLPSALREEGDIKSKRVTASMLREDVDGGPIDFLDAQQFASKMMSSSALAKKSAASNKKGKKNMGFDAGDDGRLIINDSEDEEKDAANANAPNAMLSSAENMYLKAMTSEGAFQRMPDGRIKFLKKRNRDDDDDEGDDDSKTDNAGKKRRLADDANYAKMLGRQYKAKGAGGDVKKPGMPDPYAYIPINPKFVGNKKKSAKLGGNFRDIVAATKNNTDVKAGNGHGKRSGGFSRKQKKHNK